MFRWYVVNTYSGHENKVKQNLEHRVVSLNQKRNVRQVVVPTESVSEMKDNQKITVEKRTMPGYVLVNMDLNDEAWTVVKNTPGVTGFVGAGAKLLGAIQVGHGAKIGANSVVIHDVPPNTTVVGNPGHPVRVEGKRPEGPDTDWIHLPDPIADAIKALSNRIAELEHEVAELSGEHKDATADVLPLRPVSGPSPAGG